MTTAGNGNGSEVALAPEAQDEAETLQLQEYFRVLWARKWALVGSFAFVVLATALHTFAQTPVFRATSLLLIEPRRVNVANVQGVYDPVTAEVSRLEYYRTQYEILKSRRIIEPVMDSLAIGRRKEFATARDPFAAFLETVVVEPLRDSRLVRVSVDSTDRSFATDAANRIVDQFVDESNQRLLGVSDSGLRKLKEKEIELRPKAEAAARALQQFKEENSILTLDESQSIAVQQLKLLSEDLAKARAERTKVAAEQKMVTNALASGRGASALPEMEQSRVIDGLTLELAKVEQERDDLLKHYKADHPLVRAADARVARIGSRLSAAQEAIVQEVGNRLAAAAEHEQELDEAVSKQETVVSELGRKTIRLKFLKEEADTVAASYKNIAQRIEEVEISIATGTKENNLFVIDRALVPQTPVKPQKLLNLTLGALLGLAGAIGLCFLLEYLDNTVKGSADCERLLGYPVLGFVPRVQGGARATGGNGHGAPSLELLALREPRSPIAESFRQIRTSLGFTLPAGAPSAFVVTSPSAGDGKTFVAANIAFAIAQTGKRVLLVDADMRRPRIGSLFGVGAQEPGLSTTLVAGHEMTLDAVRKTAVPTLEILVAGPAPPNPAELLGSEAMKTFVARSLARYDSVVFDAPPVTAVADAAILLAHAPHAVFVVRPFRTLKTAVRRARDVFQQARGRVTGVVINTVDVPSGREHPGYGYGYGYGYGPRDGGRSGESARTEDPRPAAESLRAGQE